MRALLIKEISSFLSSIIGYVFMLIFLLTTWLFLWIVSDYYNLLEGGEADLIPFFNLAPLILMLLIPAITMRSYAEEKRTGTIEMLYTKPISDLKILLSKYLSGLILVILTIIPTLIYYFSMHQLGDPIGVIDDGATITSYIGLVLLSAAFVSIGTFCSTLTSNQIIAFITTMFLSWFLFSGVSLIGSYANFAGLDSTIKYFSMDFHYESIKKGVLVFSDLFYFSSIILFFLFSAHNVLVAMRK